MVWTNSDGHTHTDACTYIHQTVIVTTMSCSPQAGSTTKINLLASFDKTEENC